MIKKIISILLLVFFMTTNSCYAYSKLYYLKNVGSDKISPIVIDELQHRKFNIIKSNPYYALSKDGDDNVTIILQNSGENMFYYYQSNNNKRLNRSIIKKIKKQDIACEESFNTNIIQIYDNLAQNIIPNNNNQYTFEVPAVDKVPAQNVLPQKKNSFSGFIAHIPSGTEIPVYLQNPINTATANVGDVVTAVVSNNVVYNGHVILPQGSIVYGRLSKARHATYGSMNGRVIINFEHIVTPENKKYTISTEEIDFTVSNEGKISTSVKSVAKYAALGALAGLLVALLSYDDRNIGSAVAVGAGIGAGSSLVYSTAEKGVDAEIPSYTELNLQLIHPLKVSISNL